MPSSGVDFYKQQKAHTRGITPMPNSDRLSLTMSTVPYAKTMPFKEAYHQLERPHSRRVEEDHFRVLTGGLDLCGQSFAISRNVTQDLDTVP